MTPLQRKLLILLLFPIVLPAYHALAQTTGQQPHKHQLGITYTPLGISGVFRFQSLDGGGSDSGDGYFAVGLTYVTTINHWLQGETGVEFIRHKVIMHPDFQPGIELIDSRTEIVLINLPFTVRLNFWKYFFMNGGLLLDIDATTNAQIDSQAGIGGLLGLGFNYDFDSRVSLFLNPYIKAHALIPFVYERYPQRAFEGGVRLGAAWRF